MSLSTLSHTPCPINCSKLNNTIVISKGSPSYKQNPSTSSTPEASPNHRQC